jgi:hypothetical protein
MEKNNIINKKISSERIRVIITKLIINKSKGREIFTKTRPFQRFNIVEKLISKINTMFSLDDCQSLRQKLYPRLKYNADLLSQYCADNLNKLSNVRKDLLASL